MSSALYIRRETSFQFFEINLLDASDNQLEEISQKLGVALSFHEMKTVRSFFKTKNRNPTDIELQTIGQTWSEHCFHKTFKAKVHYRDSEIDGLFKTYIAGATDKINAPWCFSVFEDNAGIVEFEKGYGIAAKVETHNHPSAVEPFGGAATGVGGVIRDVLGVWADPIACTDVLGFGPLDFDYDKLPTGVKHPKYVYGGVVAGIGNYGNNMGIPTVNGTVLFDESYTGNVVVYCGCIGLLPLQKFKRNAKAGDLLVLAGGKTGRDGIHGVTFASAELTKESEEVSRPAVQIANPFEEEKLKRAVILTRDSELATYITDLGGGGLSSAIGETAKRFGCGACVALEKVQLKYTGLAPWEIYVSESQERMLLTVPPGNLRRVLQIFEAEGVEATEIGTLTPDEMLTIDYRGERVAAIEVPFLFHPPRQVKFAETEHEQWDEPTLSEPKSLSKVLMTILASPNVASKESIVRTYDHEVKGNTVLKPFQGELAGPNDAAILKPLDSSWKGISVSCGINSEYGKIDCYWMAASAIDEAIRNNISVGGRRIALLDNFTWGNPDKPERLGSLVRACSACHDFSIAFKTPFISGKDSLYNESPMGSVASTLLITAIGIVPDVRTSVSMEVKDPDSLIFMIGKTYPELGGSEYYRLRGCLGKSAPMVRNKQAKQVFAGVTKAIDLGIVRACHDLSNGGLATAAAEMAFSGGYGINLDLRSIPADGVDRDDFMLFSESNTRFLIEVSAEKEHDLETVMEGKPYSRIGKVTEKAELCIHGLDRGKVVLQESIEDLHKSWKRTLSRRT